MKTFDITDFGAVGDGQTLNTKALQRAAEACREAGGGTVRIPAGIFLTGTFEVFGNTTLLVEKEGRLLASAALEDHIVGTASVGLLFVQDARNIVLTGEGTLDGNASAFYDPTLLHNAGEDFSGCETWQKHHGLPYGTREKIHGPIGTRGRPGNMLVFARCSNVRIEKLTITGAAYWTLHCADCEDVLIDHIRIDNDPRHPNNDGIHITSSRRVIVRDCHISTGDDAIAITGFREHGGESQIAFGLSGMTGACEEIEISDCILTSHSAGVRIGYGRNPTRKVRLSRLDIRESNRGIGIFARQSNVEDIVVEDCHIQTSLFHGNWWGRGEPIQISAVRFFHEPELFQVLRVVLRNIEATGENAVVLFAEDPGAIDDVALVRVRSTLLHGDLFESWGGNLDLRPAPAHLEMIEGGTAPLWAIGVTGLRCQDCQWNLDPNGASVFSATPVVRETL